MLYNLFEYLDLNYNLPGAGIFKYISFRSAMSIITSLVVSWLFGGKIINLIQKKQIGEQVRSLGLKGEEHKKGTPTMGGLIILSAILIPTLLFSRLDNIYIIIMIISTIWLGSIGFIDDYIKVFKKDKKGLAGKFKVLGQVFIGLFVGLVMVFHNDIVIVDESKFIVLLNAESSIVIAKLTIPFVSLGLTVYCALHESPEPLYDTAFVTA